MILMRSETIRERRENTDKVKRAALASGKFDASKLFPEYFKSKEKKNPMELTDDDIDYNDVQWETPAQDEWLNTMKLLEQNQNVKVKGETNAPSNKEFDDAIPPMPEKEERPTVMDRDDLEWE